jgi:hypothetical protein
MASSPFFVFQDWRLRNAQPIIIHDSGHPCFAEMVKTAGSRDELARQLQAGDWHIDVLNTFCFHSGLSRDLYNPLDPYGKDGGPLCWKIKTVSEFVDWYLKRYPVEEKMYDVFVADYHTPVVNTPTESPPPEPARKRGRTKKEQADDKSDVTT